jgi:hypothetical protein
MRSELLTVSQLEQHLCPSLVDVWTPAFAGVTTFKESPTLVIPVEPAPAGSKPGAGIQDF